MLLTKKQFEKQYLEEINIAFDELTTNKQKQLGFFDNLTYESVVTFIYNLYRKKHST